MLIKNSGRVLRRSLESALPYVDSYVILDYSSTDNTRDLIADVFRDLPGEVHVGPACWDVGFGALRQLNLDHARSFLCQVDGAYVLWLDAGRQLTGDLRQDLTADGYTANVVCQGGAYDFPRAHLIRARAPWAWKYRAHETLVGCVAVEPCGLEVHEWREGPTDREKYIKAAGLSEQDLADFPDDPRATFYAAQSWYDAGEYQNALHYYGLRAAQGGWLEEVWYSAMRCGMCWEWLGDKRAAAQCYQEAHSLNSARAEPARHLARMLQSREWTAIADAIPAPDSGFFVERAAYK
jgi:tetratricopeptide (TPR) repeat protein